MSSTMELEVSELSVPVPWGEIRGKVWGPDHGHPVLCLHGWADNCGSFDSLIPLLPKECRYVAVDLTGHGFSSHRAPGVAYLFSAYVADVRRIVEGLQWKRFSILGHSMGGNIAGTFSALYPDMVDTLVLLDVYGFVVTDPRDMSRLMRQGMDAMMQFEKRTEENGKIYTYEAAAERLLAANPTLSEQSVHLLLKRGLTQVEGGFKFSRDLRVNFRDLVRYSLEQCEELQSRIQASVLIILADKGFGASSDKIPSSIILQGYRDKNHSVKMVLGDHHVHLNNPEDVAPFISDFLQAKVISQQI